jgi:GDSL-like Lipase/Acylhydrolase family
MATSRPATALEYRDGSLGIQLMRGAVNLLLLLVSISIALVIGEIATRLLLRDSIVLFPRNFATARYDGVTLRRLIPNTTFWHTSIDGSWEFRTNSQGFRDDEDYQYAKPATCLRILVLGDSQTEGHEVRQSATFSKVLEQQLRASGLDAEVLNTGISGFGTADELMFLEHEGMKYRPDAVVVAFFGNDFDDNVKSDLYRLENGQLVVHATNYVPGIRAIAVMNAVPGAFWLSQNSYLFSLTMNTVWDTAKTALTLRARNKITTQYAIRVSGVDDYEKALALALLRRMKAITAAGHIPLIVVEIPEAASTDWAPSFPRDMEDDVTKLSDAYLPARSYLAGIPAGEVHVPHGHHHITELTHKKIAEALNRVLRYLKVTAVRCDQGLSTC